MSTHSILSQIQWLLLISSMGSLTSYLNRGLQSGSYVSRLLGKLPHDLRSSLRCFIHTHHIPIPTLLDLSDWLDFEIQVQVDTARYGRNGKFKWRKDYGKNPRSLEGPQPSSWALEISQLWSHWNLQCPNRNTAGLRIIMPAGIVDGIIGQPEDVLPDIREPSSTCDPWSK